MRKNLNKAIWILLILVSVATVGKAQQISITGKVVAITDKQPLVGMSVIVPGSKFGVSTNDSGNFILQISANTKEFEVTGIGFVSQKIKVGNQRTFLISMSASIDTNSQAVVVTALGIRRNRNTLPYSAQQLSGNDLNQTAATTNPVASLSGKVAGLQITQQNTMGGSTNAVLRGFKSLTQSNQALFVVDGVPYDNTNISRNGYDLGNAASDINPNDIASVSVLKGPAASALYGSRASNGVIMITTKRAKSGTNVTVDLGGNMGFADGSTLPKYQKQYGQGYTTFYSRPTSFSSDNVTIVNTGADASTGPAYDGSPVYQWDAFVPGGNNYGKATPWQYNEGTTLQHFLQHTATSSIGVSVDGANENGYYKMNYVNNYSKGMLPNSFLKRNLINFGAGYNLADNLKLSGQINYSNNDARNRNPYTYAAGGIMPTARQWWPTNVSYDELKDAYFSSGGKNMTWNWASNAYLNNTADNLEAPAYHNNPYWDQYQNYESDSRDRYFGFARLDWQISKDLSFMTRVARDYYNQTSELRNNVGSVDISSYDRMQSTYGETNYDFLFNYTKDLTQDINLKALLGVNIRRQNYTSTYLTTDGGMVVPSVWAISNSVNTPPAAVDSAYIREIDGIYAGATIGYKEILTLDGTIRRDKSSTLPSAHNTFYYPSGSLNFQFGKLLPNLNWLSNAKAWVNYAIVGADAPVYSVANTYTIASPLNGQGMAYNSNVLSNSNLKPEKTKSSEIGIEANFLHNRLGFTAAYYNAKTVDQIMPTNVSPSTGFTQFYENGGTIQNKGVELTLNVTPIRSSRFSWDVTVNWSKNKQKVLSLYGGQPQYVIQTYQNSVRLVALPGQSYQIQGTDYVYVNGQKEVDDNGKYVLNDNQYSNLGTPNPTWIGGIRNSFTYKGVSLSFLIDVQKGGSVYSLDMDYGSYSGLYPRTAGYNANGVAIRTPIAQGGGIILNGVHADGSKNTTYVDESDVNQATGDYTFSSAMGEAHKEFVYDAGYVKLRELNLNYTLPADWINGAKFIKSINVALTARNLWIIHKNLPYSDPEQGQASGNGSIGYQNGAYPLYREFGAQVKVNF